MKYGALEAGPELDALVAKKVMGWELVPAKGRGIDTRYEAGGKFKSFLALDTIHGHVAFRTRESIIGDWKKWSPSTDIAAAWEVVKTLGNFRGGPNNLYKPVIRMEYYEHDGIATVTVGRCKGIMDDDTDISVEVWERHGEANADQAMALAICRAALRAVGA